MDAPSASVAAAARGKKIAEARIIRPPRRRDWRRGGRHAERSAPDDDSSADPVSSPRARLFGMKRRGRPVGVEEDGGARGGGQRASSTPGDISHGEGGRGAEEVAGGRAGCERKYETGSSSSKCAKKKCPVGLVPKP
jgi:hypothetical protein